MSRVITRRLQADAVIPHPEKGHREPRLARCGDLDMKTIFKVEIATVAALLGNDLAGSFVGARTAGELFV